MHELSLLQGLVEQVEAAARAEGAARVASVTLRLGALSGAEREPLEFCFPMAVEGTLLEGARLAVEPVPVRVRCRGCGAESEPEPPLVACARCGGGDVELLAGRELEVSEMEVF